MFKNCIKSDSAWNKNPHLKDLLKKDLLKKEVGSEKTFGGRGNFLILSRMQGLSVLYWFTALMDDCGAVISKRRAESFLKGINGVKFTDGSLPCGCRLLCSNIWVQKAYCLDGFR